MKEALKRIWFPLAVVCLISLHAVGMGNRPADGDPGIGFISAEKPQRPDTIRYKNPFSKKGSTGKADSAFLAPIDSVPALTARDTIFPQSFPNDLSAGAMYVFIILPRPFP